MKRTLSFLLCAVFLLLCGCVGSDKAPTTAPTDPNQTTEATVPAETVKPCVHEWELDPAKPHTATCTEEGQEFYICKLCKATKAEPKPAQGHWWLRQTWLSGDCTTGMTYLEACGNCSAIWHHKLAAGEHDYDRENPGRVQEPTCTEDGFRYVYCKSCGERLKETLPAAHTPDENGLCSLCGAACPLPTDPTAPTE